MNYSLNSLFSLFAKYGVVHCNDAKNYSSEIRSLLKRGLVQKVRQKREVYYQLTSKALPLLEDYRNLLLYSAQLKAKLHPKSRFFSSLLEDLRFFQESDKKAEEFLLLSDWQLHRPPTQFQLELARERYFNEKNLKS